MNKEEIELYNKVLKIMNLYKKRNPTLFNNYDMKYIKKSEIPISNDSVKGVLLSKLYNSYIISIYIDCGFNDIISNIERKQTRDEEEALKIFNELFSYINDNDTITILKNAIFL